MKSMIESPTTLPTPEVVMKTLQETALAHCSEWGTLWVSPTGQVEFRSGVNYPQGYSDGYSYTNPEASGGHLVYQIEDCINREGKLYPTPVAEVNEMFGEN